MSAQNVGECDTIASQFSMKIHSACIDTFYVESFCCLFSLKWNCGVSICSVVQKLNSWKLVEARWISFWSRAPLNHWIGNSPQLLRTNSTYEWNERAHRRFIQFSCERPIENSSRIISEQRNRKITASKTISSFDGLIKERSDRSRTNNVAAAYTSCHITNDIILLITISRRYKPEALSNDRRKIRKSTRKKKISPKIRMFFLSVILLLFFVWLLCAKMIRIPI